MGKYPVPMLLISDEGQGSAWTYEGARDTVNLGFDQVLWILLTPIALKIIRRIVREVVLHN